MLSAQTYILRSVYLEKSYLGNSCSQDQVKEINAVLQLRLHISTITEFPFIYFYQDSGIIPAVQWLYNALN